MYRYIAWTNIMAGYCVIFVNPDTISEKFKKIATYISHNHEKSIIDIIKFLLVQTRFSGICIDSYLFVIIVHFELILLFSF